MTALWWVWLSVAFAGGSLLSVTSRVHANSTSPRKRRLLAIAGLFAILTATFGLGMLLLVVVRCLLRWVLA